jgi:hypothetical protein
MTRNCGMRSGRRVPGAVSRGDDDHCLSRELRAYADPRVPGFVRVVRMAPSGSGTATPKAGRCAPPRERTARGTPGQVLVILQSAPRTAPTKSSGGSAARTLTVPT